MYYLKIKIFNLGLKLELEKVIFIGLLATMDKPVKIFIYKLTIGEVLPILTRA